MSQLVLHIGAHRTGTTYLQQFLRENESVLAENGMQVAYPPKTRNQPLRDFEIKRPRAVVSEENILGIMEENILSGTLYPNANHHLGRHNFLLEQAGTVFFSIRRFDDWWESAITFCARRGVPFPEKKLVEKIASLPRSWNEVVDDIVKAAPHAKIVVREFEWKRDTPKQQLSKLTGWPEWKQTTLEKRAHNQRPSIADIAETLLEKGDFGVLSNLPSSEVYEPFSNTQKKYLHQKYLEDIQLFKARDDVEFWGETPPDPMPSVRAAPREKPSLEDKRVLLHIGKTGGSFLKSVLPDSVSQNGQLVLCGHGDTLLSTAKSYGRARKVAFLFRDPADRFVSGFNSRLRQGRPAYNVMWTPAEAAAFSFFERPNDLAEALGSSNTRLRSAALFAFKSIFHLKHDYQHFLHSPSALRYEHERGNIIVCCETKSLDSNLTKILKALGVGSQEVRSLRDDGRSEQDTLISEKGLANLTGHLATDYEIYRTCCSISKDLGFV